VRSRGVVARFGNGMFPAHAAADSAPPPGGRTVPRTKVAPAPNTGLPTVAGSGTSEQLMHCLGNIVRRSRPPLGYSSSLILAIQNPRRWRNLSA